MKLISRLLVFLIVLNIILVVVNVFLPDWSIQQIDTFLEQTNATERLLSNDARKGINDIPIQGKPELKLERELNPKD